MQTDFFLGHNLCLKGISKDKALNHIALFLSKELEADTECVYSSILQRENVSNTGLEKGIALPHAVLPNESISRAYVAIVTFSPPVSNWLCLDDTLVEKAICLVVPENTDNTTQGIKELTLMFQSLADDDVVNSIKNARDSETIITILQSCIK